MTHFLKMRPAGEDRRRYSYPLGRGIFRRVRKTGPGTYRFWFSEDIVWQTILVNIARPWGEQTIGKLASRCEIHATSAECDLALELYGEEGSPCFRRQETIRIPKWWPIVSVGKNTIDVVVKSNRVSRSGADLTAADRVGFDLVLVYG